MGSVVAVIALPESSLSAFPVSSSNATSTPGTATPAAPRESSPVRPVNVLPHCADVGADTATLLVSGVKEDVTPLIVEDPDPVTVTVPGRRAPGFTGPRATGQIA